MKLLIIEDEEIINSNIAKVLVSNKYTVDQAYTGKEGLYKASVNSYDLLICDVNLPGIDGFGLARALRDKGITVPVIFLTARDDIDSIKEGFGTGADDYLTKPFAMDELLLRIQVVLRRNAPVKDSRVFVNDIIVDFDQKSVYRNDKVIALTAKEYGVIEYLLRNRGKVVSQVEIIEHVWSEFEANEFSSSLRTHIKNIRKKVGNIIVTKKGLGYVIV